MLDASMGTFTDSFRQNRDAAAARQAVVLSPADLQENFFDTPSNALHSSTGTLPSPMQPSLSEGEDKIPIVVITHLLLMVMEII
jgi:hypothetical protein